MNLVKIDVPSIVSRHITTHTRITVNLKSLSKASITKAKKALALGVIANSAACQAGLAYTAAAFVAGLPTAYLIGNGQRSYTRGRILQLTGNSPELHQDIGVWSALKEKNVSDSWGWRYFMQTEHRDMLVFNDCPLDIQTVSTIIERHRPLDQDKLAYAISLLDAGDALTFNNGEL